MTLMLSSYFPALRLYVIFSDNPAIHAHAVLSSAQQQSVGHLISYLQYTMLMPLFHTVSM
jgi:hypothetical protein